MSNYRMAEFSIFIGTNGVGKSFAMKKMLGINPRNLVFPANNYDVAWHGFQKIHPERKVVKDPNDPKGKRMKMKWVIPGLRNFTGTRVVEMPPNISDAEAQQIFNYAIGTRNGFVKGGLFIDDYKGYIISKGTIPRNVRELFIGRRHREIDIFMATHSMQEINSDMVQFQPNIYLFKTVLPPNETVKNKIQNWDQVWAAYNRINKTAHTKPHYCELVKIIS